MKSCSGITERWMMLSNAAVVYHRRTSCRKQENKDEKTKRDFIWDLFCATPPSYIAYIPQIVIHQHKQRQMRPLMKHKRRRYKKESTSLRRPSLFHSPNITAMPRTIRNNHTTRAAVRITPRALRRRHSLAPGSLHHVLPSTSLSSILLRRIL
jgi:hypothetical protein